jgi:hypothetical protein
MGGGGEAKRGFSLRAEWSNTRWGVVVVEEEGYSKQRYGTRWTLREHGEENFLGGGCS